MKTLSLFSEGIEISNTVEQDSVEQNFTYEDWN